FFQAEDGIRDYHVTGVQTCALPICAEVISLRGRCSATRVFPRLAIYLGDPSQLNLNLAIFSISQSHKSDSRTLSINFPAWTWERSDERLVGSEWCFSAAS